MNDQVKIEQMPIKSKLLIVAFVLSALFYLVYIFDPVEFREVAPKTSTKQNYLQSLKDKFSGKNVPKRQDKLVEAQVVNEESAVIDVVEKVSPSVVSIIVKTVGYDFYSGPYESEDGIGTGFIVDSTGLIVTNSHVVNDPDGEYSVVTKDGSTYEVTAIHLDESSDLAIIEIVAQGLPTVELGDSGKLKVGQTAIAIGNALGRFSNTVTKGVVSGVARELTASGGFGSMKTYEDVIQTDAALNPGNSGGPLLNIFGQVIGINVATTRNADNISFAIPVNTLKPILEGFLKEGRIIKPYLGIAYTLISPEIAKLRSLKEGAFVSRVVPDSPADKAGIKRGDIITKFNGKAIDEQTSVSEIIRGSSVGDTVEVVLFRGNDEVTLEVVLEEVPETLQ